MRAYSGQGKEPIIFLVFQWTYAILLLLGEFPEQIGPIQRYKSYEASKRRMGSTNYTAIGKK